MGYIVTAKIKQIANDIVYILKHSKEGFKVFIDDEANDVVNCLLQYNNFTDVSRLHRNDQEVRNIVKDTTVLLNMQTYCEGLEPGIVGIKMADIDRLY